MELANTIRVKRGKPRCKYEDFKTKAGTLGFSGTNFDGDPVSRQGATSQIELEQWKTAQRNLDNAMRIAAGEAPIEARAVHHIVAKEDANVIICDPADNYSKELHRGVLRVLQEARGKGWDDWVPGLPLPNGKPGPVRCIIQAMFDHCLATKFDPLATLKLLNDKELAKLYDAMCDRREAIDIGKRGAITHETSLNKKRYGEKLRGFFGPTPLSTLALEKTQKALFDPVSLSTLKITDSQRDDLAVALNEHLKIARAHSWVGEYNKLFFGKDPVLEIHPAPMGMMQQQFSNAWKIQLDYDAAFYAKHPIDGTAFFAKTINQLAKALSVGRNNVVRWQKQKFDLPQDEFPKLGPDGYDVIASRKWMYMNAQNGIRGRIGETAAEMQCGLRPSEYAKPGGFIYANFSGMRVSRLNKVRKSRLIVFSQLTRITFAYMHEKGWLGREQTRKGVRVIIPFTSCGASNCRAKFRGMCGIRLSDAHVKSFMSQEAKYAGTPFAEIPQEAVDAYRKHFEAKYPLMIDPETNKPYERPDDGERKTSISAMVAASGNSDLEGAAFAHGNSGGIITEHYDKEFEPEQAYWYYTNMVPDQIKNSTPIAGLDANGKRLLKLPEFWHAKTPDQAEVEKAQLGFDIATIIREGKEYDAECAKEAAEKAAKGQETTKTQEAADEEEEEKAA
jgi:hypothetical protein